MNIYKFDAGNINIDSLTHPHEPDKYCYRPKRSAKN